MISQPRIDRQLSGGFAQAKPLYALNLGLVSIVGLLVLAVAFWAVNRSERSLKQNLSNKFSTILNIEVEALEDWIQAEKRLATYLAASDGLGVELENLQSDHDDDNALALERRLKKIGQILDVKNCLLMTIDGQIVSETNENWITQQLPLLEDQFRQTLLSNQATISAPFVPTQKNGAADLETFVMVVAAPVRNSQQEIVGFLGISVEVENEFTEILRSSRTGMTGETVVFCRDRQLISESRFPLDVEHLASDSLIHRVTNDSTNEKPITQFDMSGYVDFGGREVVGAGRWLPKFQFGVLNKMDYAEATAPINEVRRFLWTLSGLLLLTTVASFSFCWYLFHARNQRERQLSKQRLGAYILGDKIGEGGMGVVYRAEHALMRRPTAIKVLPTHKSSSKAIERFEREVHHTSKLKHPNTISIYDFGRTEDGVFYYAMEYLDGFNLDQIVRHEGPLPDGRVINILKQVCHSLAEAHQQDLVHRDIKPANIMLCNCGGAIDIVKVLDFGMVRELNIQSKRNDMDPSGTPAYMAPESFMDPGKVDARVDIYAIGAVGFYLLTGRSLIDANSLNDIWKMHRNEYASSAQERLMHHRKATSVDLVKLIAKCVSPSRDQRFQNARQLLNALAQCQPAELWQDDRALAWWNQTTIPTTIQSSNRESQNALQASKHFAFAETLEFEINKNEQNNR